MVIPDHDLLSPAPAARKDPLSGAHNLEDGVYGGSSVTQQPSINGLSCTKKSPLQLQQQQQKQHPSIIDQGLHSATTASLSNNDSPDDEASGRMEPPHCASYAISDDDAVGQCADSPVIKSIRCIEATRTTTNGLVQTRPDYRASIPHEGTTTVAAADASTSPDHPVIALRYSNTNTSWGDRDEESRSTAINAGRSPLPINDDADDDDDDGDDRDPYDPPPPPQSHVSFEEGFRQYEHRLSSGPDESRLLLQDRPSESSFIRRHSPDDAKRALAAPQYFSHCHSKQCSEDLFALLDSHTTPSLEVLVLREVGIDMQQCEALRCAKRFPRLTDLDLGYNNLTGAMRPLPLTLLRLDLSRNKIANIAALMALVELQELNVSHNLIKTFHGLPNRLRRVDLSHNLIRTSSTLRALALSPGITSIHIHHNEVTTEGLQWKVVLRSVLTQLVEIDGKSLPVLKSKTSGGAAAAAVQGEKRRSIVSKKQQRMGDAMRTRSNNIHSKKLLHEDDGTTRQQQLFDKDSMHAAKRVVLQPKQMNDLMRRLTTSNSSSSSSSASSYDIERPHQNRQSADIIAKISAASRHLQQHNPYPPPAPVSAIPFTHPSQSFSSSDVDLPAWVAKSKQELRKGVALIARAVDLSRKASITSDDLMKYSHAVHSVAFYSNHDLPLKVEYAIKKLMVSDVLFRRVSEVRGHVERVALLLHQVETAVLLSMKGAFALADSLDILMASNAGLIKNIRLLKLYGFDYSANMSTMSKSSTEMMILEHDMRRSVRYSAMEQEEDEDVAVDPSSMEEDDDDDDDLDARFDREVGAYYRTTSLLDVTSSGDDEFSYRVISPSSSPKHLRIPEQASVEANERRQVIAGPRTTRRSSRSHSDAPEQLLDRVRDRVASRMHMQDPTWTAVESSELDQSEEEDIQMMMRPAGPADSSDRLSAVLLEVAKVNTETEQFLEDIINNNINNNIISNINNIISNNNYQTSNNNRTESSALPHEELLSTRAHASRDENTAPAALVSAVAVHAGRADDTIAEVKLSAKDRLKLRVSSRKGQAVQPPEELTTRTESSAGTIEEAPSRALTSIPTGTDSSRRPDASMHHPPIQLAVNASSNDPLSVPESFLLGTIPIPMMVVVHHEDLHSSDADMGYGNKWPGSSSSHHNDTIPPVSSSAVDVRREILQSQTSAHSEVMAQTSASAHSEVVAVVESKMTAKERLLARMAKNKK